MLVFLTLDKMSIVEYDLLLRIYFPCSAAMAGFKKLFR